MADSGTECTESTGNGRSLQLTMEGIEDTIPSGRASRSRKGSAPNTPPISTQASPHTSARQTPVPSPAGSVGSVKTTPSPCGSSGKKQCANVKPAVKAGITWRANSKLEAKDYLGKWYTAKILEVDEDDKTVLIHFEGWNARYDEWIQITSERLRSLTRHSGRKEKKEKVEAKPEHKVNECVFAKWTDCRMYAARIVSIKANGTYEVVFYDGFKKLVQPINIKTMPPEVQEEYGAAGWLPPQLKRNRFKTREDLMAPRMKAELHSKAKTKDKEKEKEETAKSLLEEGTGVGTIVPASEHVENEAEKAAPKCKESGAEGEKTETKKKANVKPSNDTDQEKSLLKSKENKKVVGVAKPVKNPLKRKQLENVSTIQTKQSKVDALNAKMKKLQKESINVMSEEKPSVSSEEKFNPKKKLEIEESISIAESTAAKLILDNNPEATLVPLIPKPDEPKVKDEVLKNVVKIEDSNRYKCPFKDCNKDFRKTSLVDYHVKYYHTEDGSPVQTIPAKKRKKTVSISSADGELALAGQSAVSKKKKVPTATLR